MAVLSVLAHRLEMKLKLSVEYLKFNIVTVDEISWFKLEPINTVGIIVEKRTIDFK